MQDHEGRGMDREWWEGKGFSCFTNRDCEYFPCHAGADPERFNCLFCYCPLYTQGPDCGGQYTYLKNGVKDCSNCLIPHIPSNYGYIIERFQELYQ